MSRDSVCSVGDGQLDFDIWAQVVDSPGVADLLITLAAAASCDRQHRHSLFVGAPSDFVSRHGDSTAPMPASDSITPAKLYSLLPGRPAPEQTALLAWQTRVNGCVSTPWLIDKQLNLHSPEVAASSTSCLTAVHWFMKNCLALERMADQCQSFAPCNL